jgi:hypothetical protein
LPFASFEWDAKIFAHLSLHPSKDVAHHYDGGNPALAYLAPHLGSIWCVTKRVMPQQIYIGFHIHKKTGFSSWLAKPITTLLLYPCLAPVIPKRHRQS